MLHDVALRECLVLSQRQRGLSIPRRLPTRIRAEPQKLPSLTTKLDKALSILEITEEDGDGEMRKRRRGGSIRRVEKLKDGELPRVVLVGRPNVGKSALLNRLTNSSKAIVFDKPGITRDRLMVRTFWGRSEFMIMDTGGLPDTKVVEGLVKVPEELEEGEEIPFGVEKQVAAAVKECDMVVFVADGQQGPVDGDREILNWLRRQHSDLPILMAVNKCERSFSADFNAAQFWELGFEPLPVSAISGLGTGDLLDKLVEILPEHSKKAEEEVTSVAIIGRPNTGKSSLLNAFLGEERSIVSKVPGTTRDAIDCEATLFTGERVKLVDTAGIRRRAAVMDSPEKVEPLMVNRSMRALQQCNIGVLMIDCYEGVRQQDANILETAKQEGRGIVVVANKFDLLNKKNWDKEVAHKIVKKQLRSMDWAYVVVTSLKDEHPLKAISKAIMASDRNHSRRLTTSTINMIIQDAAHFRTPPASKTGRKGRIYYASQVSVRPPTFVLFVNDTSLFDEAYEKYIEKFLRQSIDLEGTSIKIFFRGKPPKPSKKKRV